jgi:hypothetical protein
MLKPKLDPQKHGRNFTAKKTAMRSIRENKARKGSRSYGASLLSFGLSFSIQLGNSPQPQTSPIGRVNPCFLLPSRAFCAFAVKFLIHLCGDSIKCIGQL